MTENTAKPLSDYPVLNVQGVSKIFSSDVRAVDDVSFGAAAGELIVLLGESGCGKTTTLKMINRLIEKSAGIHRDQRSRGRRNGRRHSAPLHWVRLSGRRTLSPHDRGRERRRHTTVRWNGTRKKIRLRVDELLDMVHLDPDEYRGRMPRRTLRRSASARWVCPCLGHVSIGHAA